MNKNTKNIKNQNNFCWLRTWSYFKPYRIIPAKATFWGNAILTKIVAIRAYSFNAIKGYWWTIWNFLMQAYMGSKYCGGICGKRCIWWLQQIWATEAFSKLSKTSKIELFEKILNGFSAIHCSCKKLQQICLTWFCMCRWHTVKLRNSGHPK